MLRKIGRFMLWFTAGLLLLIAGIMAYAWWQRDHLLKSLLDELNQELQQPVAVTDIHLSFARFPAMSMEMREVFIEYEGDTLFACRRLLAGSSLTNWLRGNYRIDQLYIRDGQLNARQNANGEWSFIRWLGSRQDSSDNAGIRLRELELKDFRIRGKSVKDEWSGKIHIKSGSAKGHPIESDQWELQLASHALHFQQGVTDVQVSENRISLINLGGELRGNIASSDIEGSWQRDRNGKHNFTLSTSELKKVLWWWNIKWPEQLSMSSTDWQGKGRYEEVEGTLQMEGNTDALNVQIFNNELEGRARIRFSHSPENTLLKIDSLQLDGEAASFSIKGDYSAREEGQWQLETNGELQAENWPIIDSLLDVQQLRGILAFEGAYEGRISDFKDLLSGRWIAETKDLSFEIGNDQSFKKTKGKLEWQENVLYVRECLTELNGRELFAQGQMMGLLSSAEPLLRLKLRTPFLRLETAQSDKKDALLVELPKWRSELILQADQLEIGSLKMSSVNLAMNAHSRALEVDRLFAQSMGGEIDAAFTLVRSEEGFVLDGTGEMRDIAIDQLFINFDNFGQEVLNARQLDGQLDSKIQLTSRLDRQLRIQLSSLEVQASTTLHETSLRDFAPLEELAEYVDLGQVRKLELPKHEQNWQIADSKVIVEKSLWRSNAIDVEIAGEHGFNNVVDYRFALPVQRLVEKKQGKGEFDDYLVEVQERKQPRAFVRVFGQMGKLQVELDKQALGESIEAEWKEQKVFDKNPPQEERPSGGLEFQWGETVDSTLNRR